MLYRIEKNKNKKKSPSDLKSISLYIIGHCAIELLVAFFICYCLIKLTHANPQSYIINMIAAPSIGVILAIYFAISYINSTQFLMKGLISRIRFRKFSNHF